MLGIDLGTTNSVVAVADGAHARVLTDPEGRRMVPSVVSFRRDGRTVVGYEARERRLTDAENTVYALKRLIGRPYESPEVARARERFAFSIVENKHGGTVVEVRKGKYALAEISALVLRELRRIAEEVLDSSCDRAVVTVPANFNELQRSATKAAGRVAGLEVLRILNEPTAAALAYGYGGDSRTEKVAVYDLGGGTFDITILELESDIFEVLSTAGDSFLGGEDIDGAIAEAMADACESAHGRDPRANRQAFERLKAAAEWAKCQLTTEAQVELTIEELAPGLDLDFDLSRDGLEELARPWLERSFVVCDRALSEAGLSAGQLDSVVLVGGSTRMPLCRQMVEEYFGKRPRTDIDPDMVVAQGAAIHGFALAGQEAPQVRLKNRQRHPTMKGVPRDAEERPRRQPAFAPPEVRVAPPPIPTGARKSAPAPPLPDLPPPSMPPGPAVVSSPTVAVTTPKTTLDIELDDLAPTSDAPDTLAALAPSATPFDPFADLAPADPFGPASPAAPASPLDRGAPAPGLDDPFAIASLPEPRRSVQTREPTVPFSIDRHADARGPRPKDAQPAAPPPPLPPAARRVPPTTPLAALELPLPEAPTPSSELDLALAMAAAAPAPVLEMPAAPPPILMDVTPHSLSVETAGGYCRRIILKNAPVPTEQARTFTTASEDQREVAVRICQGESDMFADNPALGEVVLADLPVSDTRLAIEVTFMLDADGTLAVEAREAETGRAQRTRIDLRGGLDDGEIDAMRTRLEAEAAS